MSPATILIVDDDSFVLNAVSAALRKSEYMVLEASDGAAALLLATRHPGPIDLVITDVCMPGMAGPELCRRIRPQRPETRYVLMSGYADTLPDALAAFLPKPFRVRDLLRTVRLALASAPAQPSEAVRAARGDSPSSSSR